MPAAAGLERSGSKCSLPRLGRHLESFLFGVGQEGFAMHTLFGFSGRINRAKWWLAVLVILIVSVVGAVIQQVSSNATSGIGAIVALVLSIVQTWISLAAGAKRLHDLNRTGAWLVLFVGAPFVLLGIFIAYAAATLDFNAILAGQTPSEPE